MSVTEPPSDYFNGIDFNPTVFQQSQPLSSVQSDERYLIKILPDTCTDRKSVV